MARNVFGIRSWKALVGEAVGCLIVSPYIVLDIKNRGLIIRKNEKLGILQR